MNGWRVLGQEEGKEANGKQRLNLFGVNASAADGRCALITHQKTTQLRRKLLVACLLFGSFSLRPLHWLIGFHSLRRSFLPLIKEVKVLELIGSSCSLFWAEPLAAGQPITHPKEEGRPINQFHCSPQEVKPLIWLGVVVCLSCCGAVRQLPPLTHNKPNNPNQTHSFIPLGAAALQFFFFLHSAHSEELKWKEKRELSEPAQPPIIHFTQHHFIHKFNQFAHLVCVVVKFLIGGLYCYNIFLINSMKFNQMNSMKSIKNKSFILFLFGWREWKLIELFAAPSIDWFHQSN